MLPGPMLRVAAVVGMVGVFVELRLWSSGACACLLWINRRLRRDSEGN